MNGTPPPNGSYAPAMPPEVRRTNGADFSAARMPPSAPEAEAQVLGSVLIDSAALPEVRETLPDPAVFYDARNRRIYAAMLRLSEDAAPISLNSVAEDMKAHGDYEAVGGYYIADLTTRVAATKEAPYFARIVFEAAVKRDVIRDLTRIVGTAYEPGADAFDVLDRVREAADAGARAFPGRALTPASLAMRETFDTITREYQTGTPPGTPTGFESIDAMLGGLRPGNLICIAGRPAMGKSTLGTSITRRIAGQGSGVAHFSMEMSTAENMERLLAAEARIDGQTLRTRKLQDEHWPRMAAASGRLAALPMHFNDAPALSPDGLRAKLHRLTADEEIKVVVVDYLQLMTGKGDNRTQEVGYVSRSLKAIAKEYGVAVVALAQLSRAVESRADKRPQLSDLRDSGEIEQDCDAVLFLYRPEYYGHEDILLGSGMMGRSVPSAGLCEVIIAKQRGGPTGSTYLRFEHEWPAFTDANLTESGSPF